MSGTTFLLVRHGEAEGNQDRRFIGQGNVPLTELGERQAETVADRLAELPLTGVLSSDLDRATGTVVRVAEQAGLELETDERLREIDNGSWQGLLPEEIEAEWPDLWTRYRAGEDVPRPGGERWIDVQARAAEALEEYESRRDKEQGLVVVGTHAGVIRSTLLWAIGHGGSAFLGPFIRIDNASVTALRLPGRLLLAVNDTGHLHSGLHNDFGAS